MGGGESAPVVVIFSGKRKSGKDYATEILQQRLGEMCQTFRLSGPLKAQYAKEHNLDLTELLSASTYKEKYRVDPEYFAKLATAKATAPVWIISDARRPTDLVYFTKRFKTIAVRVEASDETRQARGWKFTANVDDADSECALDNRDWDFVIENNGASIDGSLAQLMAMIAAAQK
eukprot:gene14517-33974_t